MMEKAIYLDYAAATPLDPAVTKAMQPYLAARFYNPSAIYLAAKEVRQEIEAARANVAQVLGARPAEIIFTAGGTEANNLAIQGVMQAFPGSKVLVSAVEHESVLAPARRYRVAEIPVLADGLLDLAKLKKMIDDKTVLLSVIYANNEIGTVQPLREVARLVAEVRRQRQRKGLKLPLYLHSDACQAANYPDLHVNRLGVDLMTLNGGKIYGPKQSGILYVKTGVQFQPQILGGGQERGARSGTENVAGIIGFAKALELAQAKRSTEAKRLQALQQSFIQQLQKAIPAAVINGSLKQRLPNNIHLTIPGQDNERLLMGLDEHGIQCAAGSACSASKEEPSHVLRAIGLTDKEAQASLRFSMGQGTTEADVKRTVLTLANLL